jgi:ATP-dependent Clp protease ATP-binding subunit ClpA
VLDIIKRAKVGLAAGSSSIVSRPRGVLFFAGPTGVGKTEMAKTLAELLFGQEDRCLRFDMSEYSTPQSDQRLLGAPPGYVGYEEGGQLTTAVRENPFSILLFDEIEKAHGSIFDKFLQILDDGRLTDGKGETVYFSECIIIFTSNLGAVAKKENEDQERALNQFLHQMKGAPPDEGLETIEEQPVMVTPDMPFPKMRDVFLKRIRDHFNLELKRPEVLNRFGDNFVVFDFIRPPVDKEIVEQLISKLKTATLEGKRIELTIEQQVCDKLVEEARKHLQHGGRGIRNVIDSALVNPLNRVLFDKGLERNTKVRLLDLLDHGDTASMRYELKLESESLCN